MIEQRCRELIETISFASLTREEQERLVVLMTHDIAMAAKASDTDLVQSLCDNELLVVSNRPHRDNDYNCDIATYTLFGQTARLRSAEAAAAQNAMAITTSLREDFVNGTHPGAVIFPLVLAEAERRALPLERMLDAAAVGLKISILLLDEFGKAAASHGYRPTTAINTIAGAAALAVAQGFSSDDILAAMAAASGMVQGLAFPFQEGTEEWLVQVPLVAHAASLACKNAKAIHFHHLEFLSGERSLGSLWGVPPDARLPANLSLTRIGVKRHPVNSFVQPVVEAVLRMNRVETHRIGSVHVRVPKVFETIPTLMNYGPLVSPNLGLLSIPVSAALAFMHQRLDFADFRMANDAAVLQLARKVQVEFTEELSEYDVQVMLNSAEELVSTVKTTFFYPSLEEELAWIRAQNPKPVPWLNRLTDWFYCREGGRQR